MFGINKNGTKHKVGIIMPAFFPSSRVTYGGGTVEEMLDGKALASVTADGAKTYAQIFAELDAILDRTKLTPKSVLSESGTLFHVNYIGASAVFFRISVESSSAYSRQYSIGANRVRQVDFSTSPAISVTDYSSVKPGSGTVFTIYA